jgi:hypothetical protein
MKKTLIVLCCLLTAVATTASAASFGMKISGPGAVNDSTIKAGTKVSLDFYFASKDTLKAFSCGFKLYSKDIEMVTHVVEAGKGLTKDVDVKGWNGWEDKSLWDFGGVWPALKDWDGNLPDTLGFAGAVVKKKYVPHLSMKVLSFEIIVPSAGTLMVDTTFYPPGGSWKVVVAPKKAGGKPSDERPDWKGPYKWKVVK